MSFNRAVAKVLVDSMIGPPKRTRGRVRPTTETAEPAAGFLFACGLFVFLLWGLVRWLS